HVDASRAERHARCASDRPCLPGSDPTPRGHPCRLEPPVDLTSQEPAMIGEELMRSCYWQRLQEIEKDRLVRECGRQPSTATGSPHLWRSAVGRAARLFVGVIARPAAERTTPFAAITEVQVEPCR